MSTTNNNNIDNGQTANFQRFTELAGLVMTGKANQKERAEFLALNAEAQEVANKIEAENKASEVLSTLVSNFKEAYKSNQLTDFEAIEKFLKESLTLLPKKTRSKGKGDHEIKGEPGSGTYAFYIKKALTAKKGKKLTLQDIGDVVVKGKPETKALDANGNPLWRVYVMRAHQMYPYNVTKTGRGDDSIFVWNETENN